MITPRQLEILQHALGLDKYGRGEYTRNYFAAGAKDEGECRLLVQGGYMREHQTTDLYPDYNCSVTDRGKQAGRDFSTPAPVLTRSQQRYRAFLDADSGLGFGEWLKRQAPEVRR